jgi:ubiquinone/menaquinone biosynthesis C-methylase UbiE
MQRAPALRKLAWRTATWLLRTAAPLALPEDADTSRVQAQLVREVLQSDGWWRLLEVDELERLAQALLSIDAVRSEILVRAVQERATPAQRIELIRSMARVDGELFERWPDLDPVLNFSWRMRTDWLTLQAGQIAAGARVLDAGAGEGQYRDLFGHTRYQAQDFAQYEGSSADGAPETWKYRKLDYVCDITAIPVADGTFDAVVCTEVLEHVPNPLAALRELVRVTAPGGRLLLTAPLGSGMHQEPYHFYGGYSRHFWSRTLPELGCEVDEIVPLRGLLSHAGQELHRASRYLALQDRLSPEQAWVMQEWLPRMLHDADPEVFIEQFTVGYMVRATKRTALAGAAA